MTNDNVTVNIDTVAFYRIVDPKKALYKLVDIQLSIECSNLLFYYYYSKNLTKILIQFDEFEYLRTHICLLEINLW